MKKLITFLLSTFVLFQALSLYSNTPRMTLIEEATNASCPPCAAYNPAFQKFINDNFDHIIPLVYHSWWPGANDPMYLENTAMNRGRIEYYGIQNLGVPYAAINGKYLVGVSNLAQIEQRFNEFKGTTSPITLTIAEERTGNQCNVSVTVNTVQALNNRKLRVAVVEYYIGYTNPPGTNGEKDFYWVARTMLPDHTGTTINQDAGSTRTYNFSYTMKSSWQAKEIYIVAFIQDDNTKEVLQAAQNLKVAKVQVQAENPFLRIPRNGQLTYTFKVTNPTSELMRVGVAINQNATYTPPNWQASVGSNELVIPPNQTQDLRITVKSGGKAEFGIFGVEFTPRVSIKSVSTIASIYVLSEGTKYSFYSLANTPSPYFAYQAILTNAKYSNDAALLAFSTDIINNYSMQDFDLVVLGTSYRTRGLFAGVYSESSPLLTSLNSLISAGKSILITSELDANIVDLQGTANGKDFFYNKLFIRKAKDPIIRVTANSQGQITNINQYPARGVANDPIGDGINLTLNQYNQSSHPYFVIFTDILTTLNQQAAKPFLYYDNSTENVGGIRIENNKSRIVYLTSGFEAIASVTLRNSFVNKIFDWLLAKGTTTLGPRIAFSTNAIDFEEVIVGQTATKTVDISNTGDEDLVISELYVDRDFDPERVFNIANQPNLPLTIKPNSKFTLQVTFSPKQEATSYASVIVIKSNASNSPNEMISLDGIGVAGNVPIITASKNEINFGNVDVQSSKVSSVDLTNTGLADLQISNIQILLGQNVFTIMSPPNLPYTLGPGEALTLSIIFSPKEGKNYNAMLRITSNATNDPTLNIPLVGTGVVPSSVSELKFSDGSSVVVNPMPISNWFNVRIKNVESLTKKVILNVYDIKGNLVQSLGEFDVFSGDNSYEFENINLPEGFYNIHMQLNNELQTIPLIIIK